MRYWRVQLPSGVRSPFEVYVNGVRQELGADYKISGGQLLFERELVSQKLGGWAWFISRPRDHPAVLTTSRRTHGRRSLSADRIARVACERFSV